MAKQLLPTIWKVSDVLWHLIEGILKRVYPPKPVGRPRSCFRSILNGIIYRMRSGVQWNQLPREFGDDSTIHRWFQRWCKEGIFEKIWRYIAGECEYLGGLNWQWQAVDGRMGKSRFGGDKVGKNPTDRGKAGTKISLATDGSGSPLGIALAGANVHDTKLLGETLDALVLEPPKVTPDNPQHLCLDKGYDNPTGHQEVEKRNYTPHIRRIGEEKLDEQKQKRYPARRWVVERTFAWFGWYRRLSKDYERLIECSESMIYLASIRLMLKRIAS